MPLSNIAACDQGMLAIQSPIHQLASSHTCIGHNAAALQLYEVHDLLAAWLLNS